MTQENFKKFLSKLNATWKPVGFWGVTLGLLYVVLVYPVIFSILSIWDIKISIPDYLTTNMMALVTIFLGSAGIRYLEKKNNITDNHGDF